MDTDSKDYELVNFLVENGFERDKARKISDDLGSEKRRDLVYNTRKNIDDLEYLSSDEKELLWNIVLDVWDGLPLSERIRVAGVMEDGKIWDENHGKMMCGNERIMSLVCQMKELYDRCRERG
jgi:hypothetical protein